jgi:hypothetical protein
MIPSDLLMYVADGHFWKLFERDHVRDINQIKAKADDRSVFQCHNRNCCIVPVFKTTVKLQRTFGERGRALGKQTGTFCIGWLSLSGILPEFLSHDFLELLQANQPINQSIGNKRVSPEIQAKKAMVTNERR